MPKVSLYGTFISGIRQAYNSSNYLEFQCQFGSSNRIILVASTRGGQGGMDMEEGGSGIAGQQCRGAGTETPALMPTGQ